jgi:acyl carrier protein
VEDNIMFEKVKNLLIEELSVKAEEITPTAELAGDLGINSLDLADLVLQCEERFGVVIDDDQVHTFITVGDIVEFLESQN